MADFFKTIVETKSAEFAKALSKNQNYGFMAFANYVFYEDDIRKEIASLGANPKKWSSLIRAAGRSLIRLLRKHKESYSSVNNYFKSNEIQKHINRLADRFQGPSS